MPSNLTSKIPRSSLLPTNPRLLLSPPRSKALHRLPARLSRLFPNKLPRLLRTLAR